MLEVVRTLSCHALKNTIVWHSKKVEKNDTLASSKIDLVPGFDC